MDIFLHFILFDYRLDYSNIKATNTKFELLNSNFFCNTVTTHESVVPLNMKKMIIIL